MKSNMYGATDREMAFAEAASMLIFSTPLEVLENMMEDMDEGLDEAIFKKLVAVGELYEIGRPIREMIAKGQP